MNSFLISFLTTALLTPGVIRLARRLGWVAMPRADRWHSQPTALMGGIAIFLGTVVAWLLGGGRATVAPLIAPATGLFLLGVIDDRVWELRPHHRLIAQIAAAAALMAAGVTFHGLPLWAAMPLTLFWIVGITNAVNLLDNMDGLAAGVCGLSALALAAYSLREGEPRTALAVLALAGGCAGFLLYNFNPAKVFMGDCGSMFIGFSLAALAIQGTHQTAPSLVTSLLVPVALLAIPIFDTTLVSIVRTLNGRPVSQGFRDHTSHRLVALGLSERATVLVLYLLTVMFGGLPLLAARLPLLAVMVLALLSLTALLVLGLFLGFLKVYPAESQVPSGARLLGGSLLHKKQLLQVLLDLVLIPVAYTGAHLLRFDGALPAALLRSLLLALPLVLAGKLAGLALCRAYRGVWRCAGPADALAAIGGSSLGSLLALLFLAPLRMLAPSPRSVLIIDWLLFTMLVLIVRLGYVLLRELFALVPPRSAPRVVILGAGAEAFAWSRQLRDPLSPLRAHVYGILDDDPAKQRRWLDGVPVLGSLSDLQALLNSLPITGCLLGVSPGSTDGQEILRSCAEQDIVVYHDTHHLLSALRGDAPRARAA